MLFEIQNYSERNWMNVIFHEGRDANGEFVPFVTHGVYNLASLERGRLYDRYINRSDMPERLKVALLGKKFKRSFHKATIIPCNLPQDVL